MDKNYNLRLLSAISNKKYVENHELSSVPRHDSESIERLVFAPSPETGLPTSDLSLLVKGGLSPEVVTAIQSLTMQSVTPQNGFESDKESFDSIIPYYINNESQLLDYYKMKGYDSEKIESVLHGESLDNLFDSPDDTSTE